MSSALQFTSHPAYAAEASTLKILIDTTIQSYKDDAHIQLQNYFLDSGISEYQMDVFRRAWAKAMVEEASFTKKHASEKIKTKSLIDKIVPENAIGAALLKIGSFLSLIEKGNQSIESSQSALKPLLQVNDDLLALKSKISTISSKSLQFSPISETVTDESIMIFRQWSRKTKVTWASRLRPSDKQYLPLSEDDHGHPDHIIGMIGQKDKCLGGSGESGQIFDMESVIGIRISSKQPAFQARGWASFQLCNEALATHHHNMFPVPVRVDKENNSSGSASLHVYERPNCMPLTELLGEVLLVNLKQSPGILHAWCSQLLFMCRFLSICSTRLLRPPSLSNIFVRSDGRLLLGRISAEEIRPRDKNQSKSMKDLVHEVVSSCLCLSREHKVESTSAAAANRVRYTKSTSDTQDTQQYQDSDFDDIDQVGRGQLLHVVEGCTLFLRLGPDDYFDAVNVRDSTTSAISGDRAAGASLRPPSFSSSKTLKFVGGRHTAVQVEAGVERTSTTSAVSTPTASFIVKERTLSVEISGDGGAAVHMASSSSSASSTNGIYVRAHQAGKAWVRLVMLTTDEGSSCSSGTHESQERLVGEVLIVVMPAIVLPTMDFIELEVLAEACFAARHSHSHYEKDSNSSKSRKNNSDGRRHNAGGTDMASSKTSEDSNDFFLLAQLFQRPVEAYHWADVAIAFSKFQHMLLESV